jgi:hypothetical protein
MKLDDLKASLFSATDGRDVCELINNLAKLAEKGNDEAKSM